MKTARREVCLYSFAIALLFIGTLIFLHWYGIKSRITGVGRDLNDPALSYSISDYPQDAYREWKHRGYRGRIIVAISGKMNFVALENAADSPVADFPQKLDNPSGIEKDIGPENVLFVATETGIARKIVHVLPYDIYSQKAEYALQEPVVLWEDGQFTLSHLGASRTITALGFLLPLHEPVLLYINASYFSDADDPVKLFHRLLMMGVKADNVVLCRSLDDPEVTEGQRKKLEHFERLLGGGAWQPLR